MSASKTPPAVQRVSPSTYSLAAQTNLPTELIKQTPKGASTGPLHPVNLFEVPNEGSNKPQPRQGGTTKAAPVTIPLLSQRAQRERTPVPQVRATKGDFTPVFKPAAQKAEDLSNASSTVEMVGFDDSQQAINLTPTKTKALLEVAENLLQTGQYLGGPNDPAQPKDCINILAEEPPQTNWADEMELEDAHQNQCRTPIKLGLLGGAPAGSPKETEEDERDPADYTLFWDIHPKDPREVANLKKFYQNDYNSTVAKHPEWTADEESQLDNKLQIQFEAHMVNKCANKEYQLPWYEKFWRHHVGMGSSKQSTEVPRYIVSLTFAGDDCELVDGKSLDEYLEQLYIKYSELINTKDQIPWGAFITKQQDLVRKNTLSKLHRELTMKERHFFWILRKRKPEFPKNGQYDTSKWRAGILGEWRDKRDMRFQAFVTTQKFQVWDGETATVLPPRSSEKKKGAPAATVTAETPEKEPQEDPPEVVDIAGDTKSLSEEQSGTSDTDEIIIDTVEEDEVMTVKSGDEGSEHDQAFVEEESAAPAMEDLDQPSDEVIAGLTPTDIMNIEKWLADYQIHCTRPLQHTAGLLLDGHYPMPKTVEWRRFVSEKDGNVPVIWTRVPMPNQPGSGTKSNAAFAQYAWISCDAKLVLYSGINRSPLDRDSSNKIHKYFGLPRLPFLDVIAEQAGADFSNVEQFDYWNEEWPLPQPHPVQLLEPHKAHHDSRFHYPPMVWAQTQKRKGFGHIFMCPWGTQDNGWESDNADILPIEGATVKDLLMGLTRFKLQKWESHLDKNGAIKKPIVRSILGHNVKYPPMTPALNGDYAMVFEKEAIKYKDLSLEAQNYPRAKEHRQDGQFYRDPFGRLSVTYKYKTSEGSTKSKTEGIVAPGSRPYGELPFGEVIKAWIRTTQVPGVTEWWKARAMLTPPNQNSPWGKLIKEWWELWSVTPHWPIPPPPAHPMNLGEDETMVYAIKLDLWWHSGVYPFYQRTKSTHGWLLQLMENQAMLYHSFRAYKQTVVKRDDKTSKQLSRQARAVGITTPQGSGAAPSSSGSQTKKFLPPRSAVSKSLPSLRAPATVGDKEEDVEKEKEKLREILENAELNLMYQSVENGTDPKFNIDISEAKIAPATIGEERANVVYYFKDGDKREKISSDEYQALLSRVSAGILDLSINSNLPIEEGCLNIGEIKYIPDTGAMMVKCGNVKAAVWLGQNINSNVRTGTG